MKSFVQRRRRLAQKQQLYKNDNPHQNNISYTSLQTAKLIYFILNVYSAMVHIAGSLLYLVKGSDQLQDWAVPREKPDKTGGDTKFSNGFQDVKL